VIRSLPFSFRGVRGSSRFLSGEFVRAVDEIEQSSPDADLIRAGSIQRHPRTNLLLFLLASGSMAYDSIKGASENDSRR
jgi:hypothetical protein